MRNRFTFCYYSEKMKFWVMTFVLLLLVNQSNFVLGTPSSFNPSFNQPVASEQRIITGTVSDAVTNEALPGVNIMIKGSQIGTVSDFNGKYSLAVDGPDVILLFSYIGYLTEEIAVGSQNEISLVMTPDITGLDEVVILAYGSQKKSNLTGSVASVSSDDIKKTNNAPTISERLKGRAAGVQVLSNASGRPGENASISIRGRSTLSGNTSPLWVVDGMLFTGAPNINPDDIESMSVLKDASSTALYGSRAAAGVIVITTKKGKAEKSELNFSYKHGISKHNTGNFKVMNSQQLYDHFTSFFATGYDVKASELAKTLRESNPDITEEEILLLTNQIYGTRDANINNSFLNKYPHLDTSTTLLSVNTNWEDYALRTGQLNEYNISYSGGSDDFSTFISGSYYTEDGILKGQDYNRYTGLANITYQANSRLKLDAQMNMDYSNRTNQDGGAMYNTYIYMPWDDPYNADGTLREVLNGSSEDGRKWYGRDGSNYLYPRQYNYETSNTLNNRYKVGATFKITESLNFEHTNNINFYNYSGFSNADSRTASGRANDYNGAIYETYSKSLKYLTNTFLRYTKNFGEHSINAIAGYEYEDYKYQYLSATGTGIIPEAIIMDAASTAQKNSGSRTEYANQSFITNANYVFKDRYLFQGSLRYDGSSRFHSGNQYGLFYTVSAGWVLSKEDFLKNNAIINFLKIRTSYGSVGNLYGNTYEAFGIYGFGFSYNGVPGLFPNRIQLEALTWETKNDFNFAIDFRLFDRMDGTVEFYNSEAKNLYGKENLSTLTGFDNRTVNFGGIANRGIEIALNPNIINTRHFKWDMNFNINFNKNEVVQIDDKGTEEYDLGSMIWKIGSDSRTFYMREWAGVDPTNGDPLWVHKKQMADGSITDTVTNNWNDATRIVQDKTGTPKYFGGFGTTLQYKDLTFTAMFNFSYGNYIYYSGQEFYDNDGAYAEYNQMVHDDDYVRWSKPGDIATHPRAIYGGNKLSNKQSTRYLHNGSYLKLGNLSLNYRIHDISFVKRLGLESIILTASADNLYTWSKFPGVNPELNSYAGADIAPVIQKYIFGINLRF